jgi:hypothetical protein
MKTCLACTLALLLGVAGCASAQPQEEIRSNVKKIYIIFSAHWDLTFCAPAEENRENIKLHLDELVRDCEANPELRWIIESAWQIRAWLERTPDPAERERLFRLLRRGQVEVSSTYVGISSGFVGSEEVNRLAFYPTKLGLEQGFTVQTATMNDLPGYGWPLVQALARSGARYFVCAQNLGLGGSFPVKLHDNPFYWQGPDGSKLLTYVMAPEHTYWANPSLARFFADAYGKPELKGRTTMAILEGGIRKHLAALDAVNYPYDAILALSGPGECHGSTGVLDLLPLVKEWNARFRSPKIILANPREYFEYMEQHYKDKIPTFPGDWDGTWESYHMPPARNAMLRWTRDHAPVAETVSSLLTLLTGRGYPGFALSRIYDTLLEADDQDGGPTTSHDYLSTLLPFQWYRLGSILESSPNRVLVFNPLSWDRTEPVTIGPLAAGLRRGLEAKTLQGAFALRDLATGDYLPYQKSPDGSSFTFLAEGVPGLGYRRYEIVPGQESPEFTALPQPGASCLENQFYRVAVDPETGFICSLSDKSARREVVNRESASPFASLHGAGVLAGEGRPTISREDGPVFSRLTISRQEDPLTTEITLYRGVKRVDLRFTLERIPPKYQPTMWYSLIFPFALDREKFVARVGAANLFLLPYQTWLPEAAHWGTLSQHVVDLREGDGFGVSIAQRHTFNNGFQDEKATPGKRSLGPTFTSLLLTGANFYFPERAARAQPPLGESQLQETTGFIYEYSITTGPGPFEGAPVAQFGWAFDVPLLTHATSSAPNPFAQPFARPEPLFRLFQVDQPNVLLTTIKRAEFGDRSDYILRFQEMSGKATEFTLSSAFELERVRPNSIVEQDLGAAHPTNPPRWSIGAWQTLTLRAKLGALKIPESDKPQ